MLSDNESNWIVGAQIPAGHGEATGAFGIHTAPILNQWHIRPHDANIATWGILHAAPHHTDAARTWLQWYMDHMDPETGYVCDYTVDAATYRVAPVTSTLTGERLYESTDACAATFLTACRKYCDATGDKTFLRDNKHAVWLAVRAMESSRQDDMLTYAHPGQSAKLLTNNCEVYQALHDVAWMCLNVYADEQCDASRWTQQAGTVGNEITARFWDHSHDMFLTTIDTYGYGESPTWTNWADATAQMHPVLAALDPWPDEFDTAWPTWTAAATNPTPAAMTAYTAALCGRHEQAHEWLRSARRTYMNNNHPLPWTIRDAAYTVATAWLENV